MLPPAEETLIDPQKLLIHNRFPVKRLTPFDYLKWSLWSLAVGWIIGGLVAVGILLIYRVIAGTYPNEQWFMDNWIFIAIYMTVFVGVISVCQGATSYNRRITNDYFCTCAPGYYWDFFTKLREDHERRVQENEEYRRQHPEDYPEK